MYDPRMAAAYHARVVEDAIHENTEQKNCGGVVNGDIDNLSLPFKGCVCMYVHMSSGNTKEIKKKTGDFLGRSSRTIYIHSFPVFWIENRILISRQLKRNTSKVQE